VAFLSHSYQEYLKLITSPLICATQLKLNNISTGLAE